MSGRRPRPMIGKLSELLVSGKKPGLFPDTATSPTTPFDIKTPSPKGMKRYDAGGVGLGIVAALENSSSNLIVVNSGKNFEVEDVRFPTSDFLSCCYLCRKQLHGRDIYMYRGEKAFCSSECRSRQILMDERKEQCRSEVSRSYNSGEIFFSTGILAI
ncbi:hypothetical protein like AT5G20700 [Hibiscus trionum]|uniref:FLZ-type domain-containing protein n=1 Tax=Hibiscus trionum TaxID=183268 RepID=A0A9W7IJK3_HIBTR|nr:hypothetical protein like AT5G20700 [Hibiscus trionum]